MLALILADGEVPSRGVLDAHWPTWLDDVELVIAADGGARHADRLGVSIDLWVGDGDSIDPSALAALGRTGVEVVRAATDKDETDTELAIRQALVRGAAGVVILGGTGGPRIDHELVNIALLAMPELRGKTAVIYTTRASIRLLRGGAGEDPGASSVVLGGPGDLVSLIPFGGDAVGVTTEGLRYPLGDESLRLGTPRGISNVIASPGATVSLRNGLLLIVETPGTIEA